MAAIELLGRLRACGVSITVDRDDLVLRPANQVPSDLLAQVKANKAVILAQLSDQPRRGDGLPPPLDRPPKTEMELRRLFDHWEREPGAFPRWLEWAMNCTGPAEPPRSGDSGPSTETQRR